MKAWLLALGALGATPQEASNPAAELVAVASLEREPDAERLLRALRDRTVAAGALEILVVDRVPRTASLPAGRPLRPDLRAVLLEGLAQSSSWRVLLREALEANSGAAARAAALEVVGLAGDRSDLAFLIELAGPPEAPVSRPVEAALRKAVAGLARRRPSLARDLARSLDRLGPVAGMAVVDGLGDAARPESLTALAGLLPFEDLRAPVLAALAHAGRQLNGPHDEGARAAARQLLDDRDPFVAAQAARAVEALEDYDAVSQLIDLLEEGGPAATSAVQALRSLSGVDFRRDAVAWSLWHGHAERRWEESRAWAERASYREGGPDLRPGLRLLASSRYKRHERAELMLRALREGSPELAAYACRGLALLASHGAVEDLIDLLDARDDALRAASHEALRSITESDLPPERGEWLEYLLPDNDSWSEQ